MSRMGRGVAVVTAIVLGVVALWGAGALDKKSDGLHGYRRLGDGVQYCLDLSEATRAAGWRISGFAVALSVLAGAMVVLGSVLGPGPDPSPPQGQGQIRRALLDLVVKNRGVLLSLGGGLLTPLALFAFSNAESADTASAAATEAIIPETEQTKTSANSPADNDLSAYYKCVGVRAAWLRSRNDSAGIIRAGLGKWADQRPGASGMTGSPVASATSGSTSTSPP